MNIITKLEAQSLSKFLSSQTAFLEVSVILFVLTIIFYIIVKNKLRKFNKEKISNSINPLSYNEKNKLKTEEEALKSLYELFYSGIWITGVVVLINFPFIGYKTYNYYQNDKRAEIDVSIVEVKDRIMIKDNKLTINELPEDYEYFKPYLDKNEPHDFKIIKDEFYQDSEVKLIDSNNYEYKLSAKDFKEIENQRK